MDWDDVVVICTIARPEEVARAVTSALLQTRQPRWVLVIDASDSDQISASVAGVGARVGLDNVKVIKSTPGLAHQRNVGIHVAQTLLNSTRLVIHFIDDDVTMDATYIEMIDQVFAKHADAVIVGGRDLARTGRQHRVLGRLTLTDSTREGRILKSGFNIANDSALSVQRVDWVSGLSQSIRLRAIGDLRFDESIRFHGEEVDFHIRASRVGQIYWTPEAHVRHSASQRGREDLRQVTRALDHFRLSLSQKYPERVTGVGFWYATFSHSVLHAAQALLLKRPDSKNILLGHADFMRNFLRATFGIQDHIDKPDQFRR